MKVLRERHRHNLPSPAYYPQGSVVQCSCGAVLVGGNPGNTDYASWRQIGWFGLGWRRLIGRIPPAQPRGGE